MRDLRRSKQILPSEVSDSILKNGITGIMAVSGDDDYPYTVPLNFVYDGGKIYFHCAKAGHKLDAIKRNSKVSFCVIEKDEIVPEEFTTYYRSVIVFGKASVIEDDTEKMRTIRLLNDKYCTGLEIEAEAAIKQSWKGFIMVQIDIDNITGKESRELSVLRAKG